MSALDYVNELQETILKDRQKLIFQQLVIDRLNAEKTNHYNKMVEAQIKYEVLKNASFLKRLKFLFYGSN